MKIGIDIGSTTIKAVVLGDDRQLIYHTYRRHFSRIAESFREVVETIRAEANLSETVPMSISGSAGMGLSEALGIPFVQEVYATSVSVRKLCPDTDVVIELGGEDAKILFLTKPLSDGKKAEDLEVRMNGSCAGGTGAFIDQMATLLQLSADEMNVVAKESTRNYTIASRCGVFAKSDIQPLLNQGAQKSDICAGIFAAVASQTVAGLAQGRKIEGNVLYLGGPLTFLSELRAQFDHTLKLQGVCPEHSLYYVARGAAELAEQEVSLPDLLERLKTYSKTAVYHCEEPLFTSKEEYESFLSRHKMHAAMRSDVTSGDCYLGIDSGSTTVKAVLLDASGGIITSFYQPNRGNPIPLIREFLEKIQSDFPDLSIRGCTATGYGEELIRQAFCLDFGVVETVAHLMAAQFFLPGVEFVIDIGGQDMKCFRIKNGVIDSIFLNEACSSGCGSFLQTFAEAMQLSSEEFSKMGLFAEKPVDLGSRCTVFMNSQVKQAQKDGASVENISAGLSMSVVKNALYKVIRITDKKELGNRIVVQGGTFLNDAVLRAFEKELGVEAVRPDIAGLMGAFGAALYARDHQKGYSTVLTDFSGFSHTAKSAVCNGCTNHCKLTVNSFGGSRKFIGGNRCERPVTGKSDNTDERNLFAYKRELLSSYVPGEAKRGTIGLPLGLNFYELLPLWHTFFTNLGFRVVTSPESNRELYLNAQHTIPSDTVCYPAKLMHGHVMALIEQGCDTIFYPCLTYNLNEQQGDNHFNCPVVAYYPEVLGANMPELSDVRFLNTYLGIHRPNYLVYKLCEMFSAHGWDISKKEIRIALKNAYREYHRHINRIRKRAQELISSAGDKPVIVLAGRPYHIDPEINHGIDRLICQMGATVVSEEVFVKKGKKLSATVLNQWTYHSRMYAAAYEVCRSRNLQLVQLVSFGCGLDAVTSDEVRDILERHGKLYTQIKIDEITNLGTVKIRLRSLMAALEASKK